MQGTTSHVAEITNHKTLVGNDQHPIWYRDPLLGAVGDKIIVNSSAHLNCCFMSFRSVHYVDKQWVVFGTPTPTLLRPERRECYGVRFSTKTITRILWWLESRKI